MFKNCKLFIFFLLVLATAFSSCKIKKQTLLLRNANATSTAAVEQVYEHILVPSDKLQISVWSHPELSTEQLFGNPVSAVNMVTPPATAPQAGVNVDDKALMVDKDGNLALPLVGDLPVKGLTIIEANKLIQEKYSKFYTDLYVKLRLVNGHVSVLGEVKFPGVVALKKERTNLLEVIAAAGDFTSDGNKTRIKIFRGDITETPIIFMLNLTNVNDLKRAGMLVHPDDIIYVEPINSKFSTKFISDVLPYLTLVTSALTVVNILLLSTK